MSASVFANQVLEHTIIRAERLPPNFAGLTSAEIGYFNYFLVNGHKIDRSLSRSQLCQDFWVVYLLRALETRVKGFFVEFGAYDGITMSNTFLLEKCFGFNGLLAEPSPKQFLLCKQNRTTPTDARCVWPRSGETVLFNTVPGHEELATVSSYQQSDMHATKRAMFQHTVSVETVSLSDLLMHHNCPKTISYMSIDTEGSEYDILASFNFSDYQLLTLSVEHNYTPQREKIESLLNSVGMTKVPRSINSFDDLYISNALLKDLDWR